MTADTDSTATDGDPVADPEAYHDLSPEEQRDLLDEGYEQAQSDWERLADEDQAATLAALEDATEQTWTAEPWQGSEQYATVPFEVVTLSKPQLNELESQFEVVMKAHRANSEEEFRTAVEGDVKQTFEDLAEWLNGFLAEITTGDLFDERFWRKGQATVGDQTLNLPAGTDIQLLIEVYQHYKEELQNAQSFRQE